jgi:hypothetical protein
MISSNSVTKKMADGQHYMVVPAEATETAGSAKMHDLVDCNSNNTWSSPSTQ